MRKKILYDFGAYPLDIPIIDILEKIKYYSENNVYLSLNFTDDYNKYPSLVLYTLLKD